MKLAVQARFGKIVLGAFLTIMVLPLVINLFALPQSFTIEGVYIRENNRPFPRFLESIKKNHGVLIIGTSETGNHLSGENYWAMLNRDQEVTPYFSVLGGAGRCSYIWFPTILANQKSFKGLQVLYFLNPTYWRDDLNYFAKRYYDRYNSPSLVRSVLPEAKKYDLLPFVNPYKARNYQTEDLAARIKKRLEDFSSYYSYDFKNFFSSEFTKKSRSYRDPSAEEIWMWQNGLDLDYNVSADYLKNNPSDGIPDVSPSDFQYQALSAFTALSNKVGIHLVVFIGPYNGILARKNSPQVISQYEAVIAKVKQILVQSNTPYIDGSDLSYSKGVFMDVQHHSTFGAWKIEQRIVAYFKS